MTDSRSGGEPPFDDTLAVDEAESYCPMCDRSFSPEVRTCPHDGARLVHLKNPGDPLAGRTFDGRFEILERIGSGGMGAVYRARQASVDREVAIKVIELRLSGQRAAAKRFFREARLASKLAHPCTVTVFDFGQTDDGLLFIAMELLAGRTLAEELRASGPMAWPRARHIALQLTDALEAAHALGIVHRDLKPSNVILLAPPGAEHAGAPPRDRIKVLDFGLAKSLVDEESTAVTRSNTMLGTPLYMPPEHIAGRPVDHRADLYSLGCILYELMTGIPPYVGDTINELCAKHLEAPLPEVDARAPAAAATLIHRLLAKEPDQRPRSATEVRAALEAVPADAPAAGRRQRAPRGRARRAAAVIAGAALVCAGTFAAVRAMRGGAPPAAAVVVDAAVVRVEESTPRTGGADAVMDASVARPPDAPGRESGHEPPLAREPAPSADEPRREPDRATSRRAPSRAGKARTHTSGAAARDRRSTVPDAGVDKPKLDLLRP